MSIAYSNNGVPPANVPYGQYVKIVQERDQWRERYQGEHAARIQAERERDQERQRQQQHRRLLKAPFKSTEKLVIEEMARQVESPKATHDPDGYTRFCYTTAGMNIGTDDKTAKRAITAILEQCPTFPIETKEVHEPRPDGQRGTIKRLYIKPTQPNLIAAAASITELESKRVQGGNQYQCQNPACLSHNVKIERQLVCMDCGHRSNLEPTFPNGKLKDAQRAQPAKTNLSMMPAAADRDSQADTQGEKNLTESGQLVGVGYITIDPPGDKLADEITQDTDILAAEDTEDLTRAAELLQAIAGDDQQHIEMSRTGEKKYYTMQQPLTFYDLVGHLRGSQAKGALCSYRDGSTRAQGFDADELDSWELLDQAARKLAQAGYLPILEESPGRPVGGHMWVIYDAPVDAAAARAAVLQIAPELADITEYWPGPASAATWNRVRLPGGFYARYGKHVEQPIRQWCKLQNTSTGERSDDGMSAARLLLASQTPAAIVPPLPPISTQDEQPEPAPGIQDRENDQAPARQVAEQLTAGRAGPLRNATQDEQQQPEAPTSASTGPRLPKVDARWIADHGPVEKTTLWFAIIEETAAAWFNEHHSLDEIRPRERNRLALSPNGNERTASTSYHQTAQGERYTDHSAHGRRPDGTRDGGDALELACKVWQQSKSAILAETTREIIKEARAGLESAASQGQPLPAWIEEIVTPAGRRQYMKLETQGQRDQGEARRQTTEPAPEPQAAAPASVTKLETQDHQPAPEIHSEQENDQAPARQVAEQLDSPEQPAPAPTRQAEDRAEHPPLWEGTRVLTPTGPATVSSVRYCDILKRWRCSVHADQGQPDGSHFAAFDVIQVAPLVQGQLF